MTALLAAGCTRTVTCADEPGHAFCDDAGAMDAGAGLDGGETDAGDRDAGAPNDAVTDAGPCAGGCDGGYCVDGACVACATATASTDCEGLTPYCSDEGRCVECLRDVDCEGSTPICDDVTHECRGCDAETTDCQTRDADLPACRADGACVACVSEADCGGNVCDQILHTCTSIAPGPVGACETCVSSAQCGASEACVESVFDDGAGGVVTEYVCLPLQAASPPLCIRPFVGAATWPSAEGSPVAVCEVRGASCAAFRDWAEEIGDCSGIATPPSDHDDACGALGVADGRCRMNAVIGTRCTYPCANINDCPASADCIGETCSF